MTVAAVLLAAGGSTRFGGGASKLVTPFRGHPLVWWAVSHALESGLDEIIVVTGAADLDGVLPTGVSVVANPRWAEGQATSLRVAIDHATAAGHDAVVVGLGDQPFIEPAAWRALAVPHDRPIVVATYDGYRGNPVRLEREVWPLLPIEGDAGARVVMAGRPDLVGELPCPGAPVDIDTPEDLDRWS